MCLVSLCSHSFAACICSSKKSGKGKAPGKGGNRYWKSIGLGFKTPREAIEGPTLLIIFAFCIFPICNIVLLKVMPLWFLFVISLGFAMIFVQYD